MESKTSGLSLSSDDEAVRHLSRALLDGKHWYIALLEAMGLWAHAEEVYNGRRYRYLIAGEAFDWLLLAERLLSTVDGFVTEKEKAALLLHGIPPIEIPEEEFKAFIGSAKYHQYLNYFYGIIVERALMLAVEAEVDKDRAACGYRCGGDVAGEAFRRVYGDSDEGLWRRFSKEKGLKKRRSMDLAQMDEFTYWRFKYRLKQCDKARIASDTKKALDYLAANGFPMRGPALVR